MITYLRGRTTAILLILAFIITSHHTLMTLQDWNQGVRDKWLDCSLVMCVIVIALSLGWLFTPLARVIAFRTNILDVPDARKIHKEPTPLLGGAAIYLALLITLLFVPGLSPQLVGILIGSGIILVMGIVDDARGLSALFRIAGQMLAVSVVMSQGVIMSFLPNNTFGCVSEAVLTLVWIVGITNALNFLDGMDGLATGLSAIAAFTFLMIGCGAGEMEVMIGCAALFGACLGFLVFNYKPAIIFLGDGGATFLGFFLASIAVMGTYRTPDPVVALVVPVITLGIIIYDIIFITISRINRGVVTCVKEWLEYTGRDHLHHRLNHLGLNHKQTVTFIWLLSAFMGLSAIVLVTDHAIDKYLVILLALIMFAVITVLMELGRRGLQNGDASSNGGEAEKEEMQEEEEGNEPQEQES